MNTEIVAPSAVSPTQDGAAIRVIDIQRAVAKFYAIPLYEMTSERRSRRVAWPRQVAMYLTREMTPYSLPRIGRYFGGRDHTTVMYAISRVEDAIDTDTLHAIKIERLEQELVGADDPLLFHDKSDKFRFEDAVRGSAMLLDALLAMAA